MFLSPRALASACASVLFLASTGCGVSTVSVLPASSALTVISGHLHGGQQPVSGASVQMYAANMTTLQGASTAMLSTPVISGSDGSFNITGKYTCPASNPLVYLVATGGNPGLPGTVNNTGIAMMTLIGDCNDLLANASTTYIWIDEITTVVAVQALAPFMTDYAHVGSASSSISGVGGAFATATDQVNFATGQFSNTSNFSLPEVTFNTLADIIAACINTSGGAGNCATLFSNTGGTTDTVGAALAMVKSPGQNTTPLYNLVSSNSPFQPYYTSVPTDFTATVGYTLPSFVQGGTLDSNGHIWLYFGGYNYNPATDTSTDSAGYIAVYDNNFNQLFTITPGTGGLNYPSTFTPDASGHVFTLNANNTVSEFDVNGSPLSPAAGWPAGSASTFSPSGSGNNYVYSSNEGDPLMVDGLGNIWGGTPYTATPGSCYFELNSSGNNITPAAGTFCTLSGTSSVDTGAVDGLGNAWYVGGTSIAKVDASGNLAATAPVSQGCFYIDSNLSSYGTVANESLTQSLLYDHVHGQLWGYSYTGAGAITDAGASVFCDYGSATLPVLPQYASTSTTAGSPYSAGSILLDSAALDGAGNLWFVSGAVTATGVVNSARHFTGSVSYASYLGEISPSGALLTPYNASNQTYGLQPTGFGPNATASVTNTSVSPASFSVGLLGIDRFGNIWVSDATSYRILKITGLAAANTVNY